jgi:hypothetical protein
MSDPNSLPGYDEWKTTDPRDYERPPREEPDPDRVRDEAIERDRFEKYWEDGLCD